MHKHKHSRTHARTRTHTHTEVATVSHTVRSVRRAWTREVDVAWDSTSHHFIILPSCALVGFPRMCRSHMHSRMHAAQTCTQHGHGLSLGHPSPLPPTCSMTLLSRSSKAASRLSSDWMAWRRVSRAPPPLREEERGGVIGGGRGVRCKRDGMEEVQNLPYQA